MATYEQTFEKATKGDCHALVEIIYTSRDWLKLLYKTVPLDKLGIENKTGLQLFIQRLNQFTKEV